MENNPAGFSIIICTYNGVKRLKPTITHIANLTIPHNLEVELIIINNASTDSTEKFVKETWSSIGKPFSLKVINEERPGKGYAVETGYDAASYSYILTVDDDNWLNQDYLIQAVNLFQENPAIGILQGQCQAAFEVDPPDWFSEFEYNFVIGSPIKQPGFFPETNYHVWGAGMVIKKSDWRLLRESGFSFLTSKVPGKAAGEDNETAMGLMLLGNKIYYSDKLKYIHHMPADRIVWNKLKNNIEVYGYVRYYFFLYALVIDSYNFNYRLTAFKIKKIFFKKWFTGISKFTIKEWITYWLFPGKNNSHLQITYFNSVLRTFIKLNSNAMLDIKFLKGWMLPLLKQNQEKIKWVVNL